MKRTSGWRFVQRSRAVFRLLPPIPKGLPAAMEKDVGSAHQDALKLREGLLVGFFLAGLVTLGSLQAYWLKPLIERLSGNALFLGAAGLTAITDNAALTYLGSLVEGIPDGLKYALVAGAG